MKASTLPARPRLLIGRLVTKRALALAALTVAALALVSTASPGPVARRQHTVYSFNGSRRAFCEWLQRAAPEA